MLTNPPSCNTGGTQPLVHPQPPSNLGPQGQKTILDTVSWSIPETSDLADASHFDLGRRAAKVVLDLFPKGTEWTESRSGTQGYAQQTQLVNGSIVCGWLQWGAYHGRLWLYLTGAGLRLRREQGFKDEDLMMLCGIPGARLKRVDIALDIYDHATFSVEQSLLAHELGKYKLPRAPQSPHQEIIQSDTNNPDYPIARTHYLGKKDADKRLRCYDKGLQLLGTMTPEELEQYRASGVIRADASDEGRLEEWTRVELVYKGHKKRPLAPEMLRDTDAYFAGGYPMLAELLGMADGIRPKYIPRDEDCELARLMIAARESYGGLLYFLRYIRGWNDTEIVDALIGEKSAARLMVDRESVDGEGDE